MGALRENYLHCKHVEASLESASYKDKDRLTLMRKLKVLLKNETGLSKQFSNLMKGYLQPQEIQTENEWRSRKWKLLLNTLSRKR